MTEPPPRAGGRGLAGAGRRFFDLLRRPRSPRTIAFGLALWLAVVANLALWRDLDRLADGPGRTVVFAGAFVVVLAAITALMMLTAWGRWMKPVWIAILIAAGIAQHFMLTYGVVMDTAMLANTMQTDPREVRDLLGWTFIANMALVIAVPAALILIVPVRRTPWWPQLWRNAVLFLAAVAVTLAASFAMFSRLAPLVRNHMHLRYIVNPIAGFTSAATVTLAPLLQKSKALVPITAGVALGPSYASAQKPPLVVVVVGETARADHFSLNGYSRDTNSELAKAGVLSFHDVRSCGTDTRDSVPCMFSPLAKTAFEKRDAEHENLLDLLQAAGLAVLWLDNQAGCKEVCSRVPTASTADLPAGIAATLCNAGECLDDALLVGLDARIARLPGERRRKGIVLVMHQMGSHGPAYYKRSAPALKRFQPECTNTTLGQCDPQQLINAYDNTIVATDRFLADTIAWLKGRSAEYAPALVYMSDHGESLGELGIFLHGLPYAFAPEAQKRVPFIAWFGADLAARRGLDTACLGKLLDPPYSHDNLYHSVLGLLDVTTPTYRRELDAFAPCRKAAGS
ncbi:MAG TPA: phosphoethanolamine--lipid A transferase [Caldimonas sp.]|nr:phosphoethanolamine--lipid A transferase [Caldimonas sp.]HEV7575863.1 phosphoethanolamine--lipid A transferase [Caldimonas sp.]